MTRRWSLVGLIVALAAALSFVVFGMGFDADSSAKAAPDKKAQTAKGPSVKQVDSSKLQGLAWWPAHEKSGPAVADAVADHHAQVRGTVARTKGPNGGALKLDGASGHAIVETPLIDTSKSDYSVAARVRIENKGFRAAVSMDGDQHSIFFLQYEDIDRRFAFAFANARAVGIKMGEPVAGRWYHLLGTYDQQSGTLSIYVNGKLMGTAQARNPERATGPLVIGRGKYEGKEVDFWSGAIADVHLFGRTLTAAEAAALAAKEPA
ncbi:LamG domain-containing protein, partial [Streptomyces sp. NPDC059956]